MQPYKNLLKFLKAVEPEKDVDCFLRDFLKGGEDRFDALCYAHGVVDRVGGKHWLERTQWVKSLQASCRPQDRYGNPIVYNYRNI